MSFLPISLCIENKKILFIGGGNVCIHKIAAIKQFTSNISIVSKEFLPEVRAYGFPCIQKAYEASDLHGYSLVYACTNDSKLHIRIVEDAHKLGILVNVADNTPLCDFISPAIYKHENISVAVSSGGTDVKKAVRLRNAIKKIFNQLSL